MDNTKSLALFLVLFALFGLWLDQQHKLVPLITNITNTPTEISGGPTLAEFVGGIVVYLFVLTLMSPQTGFLFTLLLVFGALSYNIERNQGDATKQVIQVLFGNASSSPQPETLT